MRGALESQVRNAATHDEWPADEAERLSCVQRLGLLDTPPAAAFDAVTRLVAAALEVPIALIALIDDRRVWFKSRLGLEARQVPRQGSFCAQTLLLREPLRVPDAMRDPRFADNPLVIGAARIRAYLGVPLFTRERLPVGTLCVLDVAPRAFDESALTALGEFARIVEELLSGKEMAAKSDSVLQYAMEREKLFRETFEQAAVGMVHTSLSGSILRMNQRACAMLGYSPAELRALSFPEITHPEDLPHNVRQFKRALAGEIDSYRLEQRLLCRDQRQLWTYLSVSIKRTASRQPDYSIVVIEDISQQKQAEADLVRARDALQEQVELQTRRLEESEVRLEESNVRLQESNVRLQESNEALRSQMAQALEAAAALREAQVALQASNAKLAADSVTDYLTGLPNRRHFSRRSEQAASALRLSRKAYGLILLDLDNFKRINDEYGHEIGDEVLRTFGRVLASQLRNSSDMAARLGGEEFAVLCFGDINEQTLHDVAERIRAQIGKESLATPKGLVRFTASFGLALSLPEDPDWKTVYGRADAALYEAKAAGKDRVSFGRSYSKVATARLRALNLAPP